MVILQFNNYSFFKTLIVLDFLLFFDPPRLAGDVTGVLDSLLISSTGSSCYIIYSNFINSCSLLSLNILMLSFSSLSIPLSFSIITKFFAFINLFLCADILLKELLIYINIIKRYKSIAINNYQ